MTYSIWDFLGLLGSLGIFIYGMKIMSEGIQKLAGSGLRKILKGMTSNRAMGVLTGFIVTCLVQSSSASTVMVVSFVNAGLLNLGESMGVVMGANIGTTITGWIIALFGFKVKIKTVAIILIGVTFPMMFVKKNSLKHFAEFVLGFGILFIGLDFLKHAVPDIKHNPDILVFLQQYTQGGFGSILLFVLIGTILTVVIQSSSATMAVTLVMLAQGWISFPIAAAMVLGENIGTTITANLAAIVGNVHAKRTARFHTIFNLTGVIWMLIAFYWFIDVVDSIQMAFGGKESVYMPYDANAPEEASLLRKSTTTLGLSLFHSLFNITNVIVMFGFVPFLEKLVIKLQPSRGEVDERFNLKYISAGLMDTAELSVEEARKEIQLMGRLVEKMFSNVIILLFKEPRDLDKLIKKIKKREDITDRIEVEITNYLTKISESDLTEETSLKVRRMLRMINDIERVADIVYQITLHFERMREAKTKLPEEVKKELGEMFDLVYDGFKLMNHNLNTEYEESSAKKVYEVENKINQMRDELQQRHYSRLEKGAYSVQDGVIFLDFVNSAEKIGDHLENVNESIIGMK